jgi:hypothetical protein
MASKTTSHNSENHNSVVSEATENHNSDESTSKCTYWVREDNRSFITDPNGDIVNLARLTAFAEYGRDIYGKQAHHEISKLKIDAPRFIGAVDSDEHGRFHGQNPDPVDVDGFPLLRPEQ